MSNNNWNNSVIRAVGLLECLVKLKKPTSLGELAAKTGLDKATAHRLLRTLAKKRLVQRVNNDGTYGLGPACLFFAEAYRKCFTARDIVLPYLEKLVEITGETAIYCERYKHTLCVTIERWESPYETRTTSETGIARPLYSGCSGQAILAMLPDEEVKSILRKKPLVRYTTFTPRTVGQLLRKLSATKSRGYAVSIQERNLFTAGVAAPIFDERSVIGSLAAIGPKERIEKTGVEKLGQTVRAMAKTISEKLGRIQADAFVRRKAV